jgi:hypothetical protein
MSDRIPTECPSCGKAFALAATFAGKKIRCPQCQGIIQVGGVAAPAKSGGGTPAAAPSRPASSSGTPKSEPRVARRVSAEDDSTARPSQSTTSRSGSSQTSSRSSRPASKKKRSENYDQEQPWDDLDSMEAQDDYGDDPYASPGALPPKSKKKGTVQKFQTTTTPVKSGGGTDGSVVVGILMMVGAAVWFFGGLAFGYIFYYPPVLFVLGLISTIKGALNIGK